MNQLFIHPNALCESEDIGSGTRIHAFAHILMGAQIGTGCNICDGVYVEGGAVIGNRVTVSCGVQIWSGITLETDVFVGPNATFANSPLPPNLADPNNSAQTIIRQGASIGANATILPGVEVGVGAVIGAGSVVTRSVPPNAIVVGNPARIKGYVTDQKTSAQVINTEKVLNRTDLGIGRAFLQNLRVAKDLRGELSVGEFEREVPFVPKRYFVVFNVPSREVRGEHAHKECDQFLICVRGSCGVLLDDGYTRREITLDRPGLGVYMPAMTWGTQYRYSIDAVLLVFASHYYDPDDYIRSYDEFRTAVAKD